MRTTSRFRAWCAGLVGLLVLAGCSAPAATGQGGLTTFRFGTPVEAAGNLIPAMAKEKGWLAEEGIDLQFVYLSGSSAIISALASSSVDGVQHSVVQAIDMRSAALDDRIIGALIPVAYQYIVAAPNSPVPVAGVGGATWQDVIKALKGTNIAGGGPGSSQVLQLNYLFQEAGLATSDYANIATPIGTSQAAALVAGQAQAIFTSQSAALGISKAGQGKIVMDVAAQGPQLIRDQGYLSVVSTDKFLGQHAGFDERWQRVMRRSVAYIQDPANFADVKKLAITSKIIKDDGTADDVLRATITTFDADFTTAQIQATFDFMARSGTLKKQMPVTDLVTSQATAGT